MSNGSRSVDGVLRKSVNILREIAVNVAFISPVHQDLYCFIHPTLLVIKMTLEDTKSEETDA